jgi:decaprenylphospho-beta-D-ribofuranose 2-oxidase
MTAQTSPPAGIPRRDEDLHCYSALYETRACVYRPKHPEQLRRIFEYARTKAATKEGCRVTFRGGAHSFDEQSLGKDVVVSMAGFDDIQVLSNKRIRVGPGATWGAILATLEPLGLLPAVTVTSSHATAGGTLSGDCLSRFSPAYGKEGEWIESFDMVLLDGRELVCTPPPAAKARKQWTLGERAFYGAISGLGYLGAVVSITYKVHSLKQKHGPIGVSTTVKTHQTFKNLAADLVSGMKQIHDDQSDPTREDLEDAIYAGLYRYPDGKQSAIVFRSTITTKTERRPLLLHQPNHIVRIPVQWLMRIPRICRFAWDRFYADMSKQTEPYIDDLEGFTFFMDGDTRAKRIGQRLGFKMQTIQQTFVVPNKTEGAGDLESWEKGKADLAEWLAMAFDHFRSKGLTPTLADVLFLPKDEQFLLSATAGLSGFAVSFAFETSDKKTLDDAQAAFIELSDLLWKKFQGRVYLVKNVHAKKETLAAMYGQNALDFFKLKRELDPGGLLCNKFLERTFPDLLTPATVPPAPDDRVAVV